MSRAFLKIKIIFFGTFFISSTDSDRFRRGGCGKIGVPQSTTEEHIMIQHHHGHFTYNHHTTIRLPDGLCLDFSHEVIREEAFELVAPDGSFRLVIELWETPRGAQTFTQEIYEEHDCITALEPVRAIQAPCGLSGYTTTYALSSEILEEIVLDLPGEPHALLNAWFSREKGKPFDETLYARAKAELLAGIRQV